MSADPFHGADSARQTASPSAASPAEQIVVTKSVWANTFRMAVLVGTAGWVAAALQGFVVWDLAHRPVPVRYFEAVDGQLVQTVPTTEPMLSDSAILTGAEQVLLSAYNMNYRDTRMRMQEAARWFTPEGYAAYQKSLIGSGDIASMKAKLLIMNIVLAGTPILDQKGPIDGAAGTWAWKVQIPVQLTFQSLSYERGHRFLVTMIILRVNNVATPRGWAVYSIAFGPMPSDMGGDA